MRYVLLTCLLALACSDSTSSSGTSLTGTWTIAAPSGWSTFRMTLQQSGTGTSGTAQLAQSGPAKDFDGSYTVQGTAAVDTFALRFAVFSGGGTLDLYGRVLMAGSLRATLVYTDLTLVTHPVSQYGELDRDPTELHFNR